MQESYLFQGLVVWLLNAAAVMVTAHLIPGMSVDGFIVALIAALVLALVNTLMLPVLRFITFPLTVMTLGLFWFVLNGAMLKLTAGLLDGFAINGWIPAIIGALVLTVLQSVFRFAYKTLA